MKKIVVLGFAFLVFGCNSSKKAVANVESVSASQVKELVTYLASDELQGRDTGSQGIDEAATYIEKQLETYGVKPYYDTYRDNFKVKEQDAFNVVGFLKGNDDKLKDEVIILGAHYDHIGIGKAVNGDEIANGANDNAAGTSAVLSLAKYFAARKNNKRSIMFVLFSAEEKGLLGSSHLAERLKSENANIYTMVNFEMIGVPMKDKNYEAYISGYDLSNMADKINEYSNANLIGLLPKAKEFNLFQRSDNYPFYKAFSVPSQTICTFDFTNYEFYHHVDDEAENMDYEFMASLINKIKPAIEKMSNSATQEIKMYD